MSTPERAPTSLLHLPPEIRRHIFIIFFRSFVLSGDGRDEPEHERQPPWPLAILSACRLTYREAEPLVLPNARVSCQGNADLLRTLSRIGPARIPQLRHLILTHDPVAFRFDGWKPEDGVPDEGEDEYEYWVKDEGEDEGEGENEDEDEIKSGDERGGYAEDGSYVRWFNAGALLGLFPGLQLDLLEVYSGRFSDAVTEWDNTETFGSLLEADGYRRLLIYASAGGNGAWRDGDFSRWERVIDGKFRPHDGWKVEFDLGSPEWQEYFVLRLEGAGITVVGTGAGGGEDDPDVILDRGAADFAVKPGDTKSLRCIETSDEIFGRSFYKEASDALRKLFRENSWEAIEAMEGFDVNYGDEAYGGWM
ncbi:hypothetical protein IMZ48_08890 [Candidatus Bathyarchaeota archaeon]|nr:hypothetical protein [Candidatus Bathyarchaeota archaeon]